MDSVDKDVGPELASAPEAWTEHVAALRRLARALVGDRHADDLAQDAWLNYLRARPAAGPGLRNWLVKVVLRRASNVRRENDRRAEREKRAARPESSEPVAAFEREELLRRVTAAVLELDDEQRRVVMLRWFDGLAPRVIAAQLGLAPSVVHSRLTRAHTCLRRKLERDFGGQRARVLLAWLSTCETPTRLSAAAAAGTLAMGLKWLAAGAVLVVVMWLALRGPQTQPGEPLAAAPKPNAQPGPDASVLETPAKAAEPEPPSRQELALAVQVETEAPQSPWTPPQHEYELELTVTDRFDRPSQVDVLAAPEGQTLNHVGRTSRDGLLVLRWRGFEHSMLLDLGLALDGQLRRETVTAGRRRVKLRLFAELESQVIQADGVQRDEARLSREHGLRVDALRRPSAATEVDPPLALRDDSGHILFVEPDLVAGGEEVGHAQGDTHARKSQEQRLISLRRLARASPSESSRIALVGRVVHADGAPASGVAIGVRPLGVDELWFATATDSNGEYRFRLDGDGPVDVSTGGWDAPVVIRTVHLDGAGPVRVDTVLPRGEERRGRLLDLHGRALTRWLVLLESAERDFADSSLTDDEGRFSIPDSPDRTLRALAAPPGAGESTRLLAVGSFPRTRHEIDLHAQLDADHALGGLRVELPNDEGRPLVASWALAWRLDCECAALRARVDTSDGGEARFVLFGGLPEGEHRVELAFEGRDEVRIDAVRVRGGDVESVSSPTPEAPGELVIESKQDRPLRIDLVRRAAFVELRKSVQVRPAIVLRMPAGEYRIEHQVGARLSSTCVTVRSGERTSVGL